MKTGKELITGMEKILHITINSKCVEAFSSFKIDIMHCESEYISQDYVLNFNWLTGLCA